MANNFDEVPGVTSPAQPTEEGAIENQPAFRKAVADAWTSSGAGTVAGKESGFTVNRGGVPGPVKSSQGGEGGGTGSTHQLITDNTSAAVHTHPRDADSKPSSADIAVAKKTGKPILVQSKDGLMDVIPGTGKVVQTESGTDWMDKKSAKKSDNKKVAKTTDIEHLPDNSHVVRHKDADGKQITAYSARNMQDLHSKLRQHLGQNA